MSHQTVFFVAVLLLIHALLSGRLRDSIITGPLFLGTLGFLLGPGGLNVVHFARHHTAIHIFAEATLVLVLFTDSARIDLNVVRRDHNLPASMLAVGVPLAILLTAVFAIAMFPEFSLWEAALLAALLAPTDAAPGQSVASASIVPARIRQAINVEGGLNDGIALPAVLLFATLSSMAASADVAGDWVLFAAKQVSLGPLTGVVIG